MGEDTPGAARGTGRGSRALVLGPRLEPPKTTYLSMILRLLWGGVLQRQPGTPDDRRTDINKAVRALDNTVA